MHMGCVGGGRTNVFVLGGLFVFTTVYAGLGVHGRSIASRLGHKSSLESNGLYTQGSIDAYAFWVLL